MAIQALRSITAADAAYMRACMARIRPLLSYGEGSKAMEAAFLVLAQRLAAASALRAYLTPRLIAGMQAIWIHSMSHCD